MEDLLESEKEAEEIVTSLTESKNEIFGNNEKKLGSKAHFELYSAGSGRGGDFYYILRDTKNNREFKLGPSEVDFVEELLQKYGHRT